MSSEQQQPHVIWWNTLTSVERFQLCEDYYQLTGQADRERRSITSYEIKTFWELDKLKKAREEGVSNVLNAGIFVQYAASAPKEIPEWFVFNPQPMPKQPKHWVDIQEEEDKRKCANWHDDPCYDLFETDPHLKWYQDSWQKHNTECADVRQRNAERRFFEWRMYYAKIMTQATENHFNNQ